MSTVSIEKQNRKTISSIETFFDSLLRGKDKLSENIFFEDLPTTLKKEWKEFVLVDCGNPQRDKDSHSVQTVLVSLYVMPNAYGKKDVKTLQRLESKLNELIEGNTDEHYHTELRGRYSNYNAVNDVFLNIVQINLIIT